MKREVLSLVVACPNSSDGCAWKGEVRYIEVSHTITNFFSQNKANSQVAVTCDCRSSSTEQIVVDGWRMSKPYVPYGMERYRLV